MAVDTVIWPVIVTIIVATLMFVAFGAGAAMLEQNWDATLFGPKPQSITRIRRALDIVLWIVPSLFVLMFLYAWFF